MDEIRTDRLIMRALQKEDANDLVYCHNHEGQNTYLPGMPYPYDQDSAEWFIEEYKDQDSDSERVEWAIEYEGSVIGACNFHRIKKKHQHCCIGYAIGKPYAGKGFGTETARGLVDYLFEHQNMHYIRAEVFDGNIGSLKVLEKVGFKKEGFSPEHTYHQQRYLDQHQLGIRKHEFKK